MKKNLLHHLCGFLQQPTLISYESGKRVVMLLVIFILLLLKRSLVLYLLGSLDSSKLGQQVLFLKMLPNTFWFHLRTFHCVLKPVIQLFLAHMLPPIYNQVNYRGTCKPFQFACSLTYLLLGSLCFHFSPISISRG